MLPPGMQGSSSKGGQHLILFDGICGLCNGFVQTLLKYDRRRDFNFASLQSTEGNKQLARFGAHPRHTNSFFVIANYESSQSVLLDKSGAAFFILKTLGWPWKAAGLAMVLPSSWLDRAYDIVAQNRYRIFGKREYCVPPAPEYRCRFLDTASDDVPELEVRI
jgi:predicted DCC family thiol-disulfide oxidoreductase YuxK